jgi:hypothetical protein
VQPIIAHAEQTSRHTIDPETGIAPHRLVKRHDAFEGPARAQHPQRPGDVSQHCLAPDMLGIQRRERPRTLLRQRALTDHDVFGGVLG